MKEWTVTGEDGTLAIVRGGDGTYWVDHEGGTSGPYDTKAEALKDAVKAVLR